MLRLAKLLENLLLYILQKDFQLPPCTTLLLLLMFFFTVILSRLLYLAFSANLGLLCMPYLGMGSQV